MDPVDSDRVHHYMAAAAAGGVFLGCRNISIKLGPGVVTLPSMDVNLLVILYVAVRIGVGT